jgi:hypothetical protein
MLANIGKVAKVTHHANESLLVDLNLYYTLLIEKLKRARRMLSDQQVKLKVMQTAVQDAKRYWHRTEFVPWRVVKW